MDLSEYPNMDAAPRVAPVASGTKMSSSYPNSPLDPRANQKDILGELIAAGQKPNQDLLSDILYNYSKTPQQNLKDGAGLALDLPSNEPQEEVAEPLVPKQPRVNQPQGTKEASQSMTDEGYMNKMLREKNEPQPEEEAQVAQADAKVEQLQQVLPAGDPELEAAMAEARDRRRNLLLRKGVNQVSAGLVGAKPEDPSADEAWQQYAAEPLTELNLRRKSEDDKKAKAREDEKFGMDKQKFNVDLEKGKLDLDKARQDMADSKEGKDPNSELSQGFKLFLAQNAKMAGVSLSPEALSKLSYAQLSKLNGSITNLFTTKMAADAKKDAAKESALNREANRENKLTNQNNDRIQTLRKEATSGAFKDAYQIYATGSKMAKSLEDFAKDPTGYSDYGTLMGGLKTLQGDSSVVREAEIRLGMNAGSLKDKLENAVNSVINGKSLTDVQRKAIAETIKIMNKHSREGYLESIQPLLEQADELKIDRKFILPPGLRDDVAPKAKTDKKETKEAPVKEASTKQEFTPNQEKAIDLVMTKNKVSREKAVDALKKAGKL